MDCISTETKKHCTCTYAACDKWGNCCKCIAFHQPKGQVPGCLFTPAGEKTYDRSLENFFRDRGK